MRAASSQGGHERVSLVAAVGHDAPQAQAFEQRQSLRRVVALTSGEATAPQAATCLGG